MGDYSYIYARHKILELLLLVKLTTREFLIIYSDYLSILYRNKMMKSAGTAA